MTTELKMKCKIFRGRVLSMSTLTVMVDSCRVGRFPNVVQSSKSTEHQTLANRLSSVMRLKSVAYTWLFSA